MKNKIVVRAVIGLFAIAVLFLVYEWFKGFSLDPDLGTTETTDMIAALEYSDDGDTLVLFDSDATKPSCQGTKGNRTTSTLFGGRTDSASFHHYARRALERDLPLELAKNLVREEDRRQPQRGSPYFWPAHWPNLADSGLITLGATCSTQPAKQKDRQLLPPTDFARAADPGAAEAVQGPTSGSGSSFKSAKWARTES